jgi:hypothetical protein
VKCRPSLYRADAAEFGGLFHKFHCGGNAEVYEFIEVHAAAAGLRFGEFLAFFSTR